MGRSCAFAIHEPWTKLDDSGERQIVAGSARYRKYQSHLSQFASSIVVHFAQLEEAALHGTTALGDISASRSLYPAYRIPFASKDDSSRSNPATSERLKYSLYCHLQT